MGGNEVHVRSRGCLADGGGIVGVVLAALALDPVRSDELSRNHAGIETPLTQLATPVVGTTASLHRHEAAWWEIDAPSQELLTLECPVRDHLASGIDRMDLNHILGQIDTNSCNVAHGTSPFKEVRLTSNTPILALDAVARKWEVPSYSVIQRVSALDGVELDL